MPLLITAGLGAESGGMAGFVLLSATASDHLLTLTFNAPFTATGPAADVSYYTIVASGGARPVTVTGIQVVGSTLLLTTTAQTNGGAYTVFLPFEGLLDTTNRPFAGPFSFMFVGFAASVAVSMVRSIDARTLDVIFTLPVVREDALNPANYSSTGGISILSALYVTDLNYRLTTTKQTEDVSYTLTISNIREL